MQMEVQVVGDVGVREGVVEEGRLQQVPQEVLQELPLEVRVRQPEQFIPEPRAPPVKAVTQIYYFAPNFHTTFLQIIDLSKHLTLSVTAASG